VPEKLENPSHNVNLLTHVVTGYGDDNKLQQNQDRKMRRQTLNSQSVFQLQKYLISIDHTVTISS